ncbi:MAG: phage major capsid protein [Candidatus Thorarchaeota archaeon]
MPVTLPSLTRTIDDDFTNTWYEIRPDVVDNILDATILWMALKDFGCLTPQVGGEYVTRTVGYGEKSTQRIQKGTVLTQSAPDLDTMGIWNWRYFVVDINRSTIDDAKNAGKFRIKSYLARRLEAARNAIVQDLETYVHQWGAYYSGVAQPNGLYDICPANTAETAVGAGSASDSQQSGTSNGGISRADGNEWWTNWCAFDGATEDTTDREVATNASYTVNLLPDMRHFFNLISANQESPNFIICDQNMYEAYEDEASDRQQIVRNAFTKQAVDLGFEAQTFKGATFTYSGKLAGSLHLFMLNMNHIEFVYDPNLWFDMTDWKDTANQLERVAYIVCMTPGLITDQPRRHGIMEYAS